MLRSPGLHQPQAVCPVAGQSQLAFGLGLVGLGTLLAFSRVRRNVPARRA
jgi:hypothetical protein